MPDFLLEIGCEEIPARMLDAAKVELGKRIAALLVRESLLPQKATGNGNDISVLPLSAFATPRRLAVLAPGVAASQPDVTEQLLGPSTKVAFKDGKPTAAAEAFAKKCGVEPN